MSSDSASRESINEKFEALLKDEPYRVAYLARIMFYRNNFQLLFPKLIHPDHLDRKSAEQVAERSPIPHPRAAMAKDVQQASKIVDDFEAQSLARA
jgi:hypothetical protein